MKVCVTKAHIENGVEKDSHHCMIADAVKAACPTATFIMVDLQTVRFTDSEKKKRFIYLTPPIAQQNLLRFDLGKGVAPFAFSLTAPAKVRAMRSANAATPKRRRQLKAADKRYRAKKYAYLAANRARNHQKEREFGLRKFA